MKSDFIFMTVCSKPDKKFFCASFEIKISTVRGKRVWFSSLYPSQWSVIVSLTIFQRGFGAKILTRMDFYFN